MTSMDERPAATDALTARRLAALEQVCRGLSHEASNRLLSIVGQTELAEEHLRLLTLALRYADRLVARAERAGGPLAAALPAATIATLRARLRRAASRRRLAGLRRSLDHAQLLAAELRSLHLFASSDAAVAIDVNAAARAAATLLGLAHHQTPDRPPRVSLDLAEGLPAALGSAGLVTGIIIDLAGGAAVEALTVATRRAGEEIVCEVGVSPASASVPAAAALAARLCGGDLTLAARPGGAVYELRLPTAEPPQARRSGNA
jgi:hypothetical protein